MDPEEAVARYRAELMERYDSDFIPYTFQVPVSAIIAKIHTIEWTTQLLYDEPLFEGMNSNWNGLFDGSPLVEAALSKIVTSGFAKGSARIELAAVEEGTELSYQVDMQVGGKLAQIGSRLVSGAARKIADQFFTAFNEEVANA